MVSLGGITNRVWDFISPRKTQQRREKPFKVPTRPAKHKAPSSSAREMSIETKFASWKVATPSTTGYADVPPSAPSSSVGDLEGDTFDRDSMVYPSVEDSHIDLENPWTTNEQSELVDDGTYRDLYPTIDREAEIAKQQAQGRNLRNAGWSDDAVFLFQKLNLRGFEPLLPSSWVNDFPSLALDLFTVNDDKAFIRSESDSDFRAQHALSTLFNLGGVVRDAVFTKAPLRTPESHISNAVKKYYKWAVEDVKLRHVWQNISLFQIVICDKDTHSSVAERKMISKLSRLYFMWHDAFRVKQETAAADDAPDDIPTLYGVIASHTVMAFVSFVLPTNPLSKGSLRTIAIFDFSQEGYDVWNSFAIAIFVIHCRNRMKELHEYLPLPEIPSSRSDPDK